MVILLVVKTRRAKDEYNSYFSRETKGKVFKASYRWVFKRLSRYCKLEIIELPDEKTPDNASEKRGASNKRKEGKLILSK